MCKPLDDCTLFLSIFPSRRGLAFAFFDGAWTPLDWGYRRADGDKNVSAIEFVKAFIQNYKPEILLLPDPTAISARHGKRVSDLLVQLEVLGNMTGIHTVKYSREHIQECFEQFGASTRYEIADAISKNLPEMTPQLPPQRKPWLPENGRMRIFDAVSLIFTHIFFMAIKPNTKNGK